MFSLVQQSAAPHPRLSAAAEEPVAEAAHDRHHRLAHDLDRAAVGLRAAGGRLVRAHRAQVGDAAHAVHPRRREGDRVPRGQVRLGDLRADGQGDRRARRGARHHRVQRSRRPRALLRRAVRPVLLERRVRAHRRRQGGRRHPRERRPTCRASTWDAAEEEGLGALHRHRQQHRVDRQRATIKPDDTITPFPITSSTRSPTRRCRGASSSTSTRTFYLEMGETLPTHKDPPTAGGKYPLQLTGGHTRWWIHSAWRDDARHAAPAARRADRVHERRPTPRRAASPTASTCACTTTSTASRSW